MHATRPKPRVRGACKDRVRPISCMLCPPTTTVHRGKLPARALSPREARMGRRDRERAAPAIDRRAGWGACACAGATTYRACQRHRLRHVGRLFRSSPPGPPSRLLASKAFPLVTARDEDWHVLYVLPHVAPGTTNSDGATAHTTTAGRPTALRPLSHLACVCVCVRAASNHPYLFHY